MSDVNILARWASGSHFGWAGAGLQGRKKPALPLPKQLQFYIVVWLPRRKWDRCKRKKRAVRWMIQESWRQEDDRTNTHINLLLAAWLVCGWGAEKLDGGQRRHPFPLVTYFVAMSLSDQSRVRHALGAFPVARVVQWEASCGKSARLLQVIDIQVNICSAGGYLLKLVEIKGLNYY